VKIGRMRATALLLLLVTIAILPGCKKEVPLTNFSSVEALQNWLRLNDVSERPKAEFTDEWHDKAKEIVKAAAKDGYKVEAHYAQKDDFYSVYCQAAIDGKTWYWDPETDDPSKDIELVKVQWKPLQSEAK